MRRLAGMRDIVGDAYSRLGQTADGLRDYLSRKGYEAVDTPLLEDAELFVRKSGGELTSRMYTFTDPGGHRVSLRPEFTSSLIRHFIEEGDTSALPARWQYGGPVFRYERGDHGGYRQFTQVGAELIGAGGVDADAEVLAVASLGLQEAGLRGHQVRVGHLGVLRELLKSYGLSEPARLFVIGNLNGLKTGLADVAGLMQQARDVGLLRGGAGRSTEGLTEAEGQATRDLIQGVLTGAVSGPMGRRTTEQIVDRLLRKVREADAPDKLKGALTLASELASVEGSPASALEQGRAIAEGHGLKKTPFDDLGRLFEALASNGLGESRLVLDLGLVRGIAYYSGVIFELFHTVSPDGASLGGGGRYDGLVRALGGDDVPALGFAYALEQVVNALEHEKSAATKTSQRSRGRGRQSA